MGAGPMGPLPVTLASGQGRHAKLQDPQAWLYFILILPNPLEN